MKITRKKRLFAAVCVTGMLCVRPVQAYFTDFSPLQNVLHGGGNTTDITEEFPSVTPTPIPENPSYKKNIAVSCPVDAVNGHNADCYVRVRLSYSNEDIGRAVVFQGMDTQNWIYDKTDGYYYYRNVVGAGQKTTALCSGFSIKDSEVEDTYKEYLKEFSIYVYEESVQAHDFKDYKSAWNYYKNPVPST